MPKQRFGLGRGLDALIPGGGTSLPGVSTISDEIAMDTSLSNSALFEVPITAITTNPQQPRMPAGDDEQLRELAASIQEYGLLQPLLVALNAGPDANLGESGDYSPAYTLIAGERRWRAAKIAGLERVPVIIRDATPQLMLEMALIENLQRTDLNPLEAAEGYRMLIEEYHLTEEQVAERVGRKRPTIANTIRLLQLPPEVREALVTVPGVFTEGHARAVLSITTSDTDRINAMQHIIAERMSVRGAEELARRYNQMALRLTPDRRGARVTQASYETRALEEEFTRAIELKVRLQRNTKGKGSLTLFFTNEEQLQTLYDRIVHNGIPADRPFIVSGNGALGYSVSEGDDTSGLLDDTFDITFDGGEEPGSDN